MGVSGRPLALDQPNTGSCRMAAGPPGLLPEGPPPGAALAEGPPPGAALAEGALAERGASELRHCAARRDRTRASSLLTVLTVLPLLVLLRLLLRLLLAVLTVLTVLRLAALLAAVRLRRSEAEGGRRGAQTGEEEAARPVKERGRPRRE